MFHSDDMDQGSQNASNQERKADLLPADQKPAGGHQLDVSSSDGSALGHQEDQEQRNADAEQADERIQPRGQICEKADQSEAADENIKAEASHLTKLIIEAVSSIKRT